MPPRRPRASQNTSASEITADDLKIFERGKTNANWITDHYVRTPTSGTYWRNVDPLDRSFDPDKQVVWTIMHDRWAKEGKADTWLFGNPGQEIKYNVLFDADDNPVFHHHHGWLFLPWQLQGHHAPQPDITVIGGVGSAKTAWIAMSLAVLALTIPNFRGFGLAPQMIQAMEIYNYLSTNLSGTPYWDRFVFSAPTRPFPKVVIRNSYVGESVIQIFSIEDDPKKILTLEGDAAYLDQAEKFDDLEEIERNLGTRLRGAVRGRARLGRMVWSANAGDNPMLWSRFDMGEYLPQFYLSLNPRSTDNPFLSKTDIENLKRRVGGTAEEIEQWMEGKRPMGSGEHFSRRMVTACRDEDLQIVMDNALKLPLDDPRRQGFVCEKRQDLGIYRWEMPPEHEAKRDYIVISDPGSGDPPGRNSATMMVFDVTEFPEKPMVMRAFNWIFGGGSYWPWVLAYKEYVERYRAFGRNAFDSTGVQKGFDELVFHEMHLAAEGMNMAVSGKMKCLNSLKFFMGKGLIQYPYIAHLENQLTNYKLPDNKIRQDLVMCLAMAAGWAQRLYYTEILDDDETSVRDTDDGQVGRYRRDISNRYTRREAVVR